MPRKYDDLYPKFEAALIKFDANVHRLRGIQRIERRNAFLLQLISSLRRIEFVRQLSMNNNISPARANPCSDSFDPLRAAVIHRNNGDHDEAIWIVFLATHFGKHKDDGWRLMRDIYAAFNTRPPWTWANVSQSKNEFRDWATRTLPKLLNDGVSRRFSNHRKYESKKATADVVLSYVDLVSSYGQHRDWIQIAHKTVGQNPTEAFDYLYKDMRNVRRFGRLGTFDFLTMLGKLDLFPITPGIAYLDGATGPLRGARLLVDNDADSRRSAADLERILSSLDDKLEVGKQVLEDSMCNWQKSPDQYLYFRG